MAAKKRRAGNGPVHSRVRSAPEPVRAFPALVREKVRYSDTDRQGHVNNVAFSVFFEAGRAELLFCSGRRLNPTGTEFVLASTQLELLQQLRWPGEVVIGTRVESLGRSSFKVRQAIYQHNQCAAVSTSVMVLTDAETGRSVELGRTARRFLKGLSGALKRPTSSTG